MIAISFNARMPFLAYAPDGGIRRPETRRPTGRSACGPRRFERKTRPMAHPAAFAAGLAPLAVPSDCRQRAALSRSSGPVFGP
jgi:hypothetical protein